MERISLSRNERAQTKCLRSQSVEKIQFYTKQQPRGSRKIQCFIKSQKTADLPISHAGRLLSGVFPIVTKLQWKVNELIEEVHNCKPEN